MKYPGKPKPVLHRFPQKNTCFITRNRGEKGGEKFPGGAGGRKNRLGARKLAATLPALPHRGKTEGVEKHLPVSVLLWGRSCRHRSAGCP